ncbi:MAG TPA: tetratricopeptide repeat protein [Candidatus Micrarchaeia archaeon]|nr:tetratricopeptide repeat protein [Candidatus Micrarchaeia archaeon]
MSEAEDRVKPRVQAVEEAIQHALQSRWQEAADFNQDLLDRFGADEDAYNRLGKALLELGRLDEAQAAYAHSLELNPLNPVAARQRGKIAGLLAARETVPTAAQPVDVNVFTEEPGKTALSRLPLPEAQTKVTVAPGDPLTLELVGDQLRLRTARGVDLGTLEAKLARRLLKLVRGGNRYAGAVTHVEDGTVQVIIREVFQAPELAGTLSFPIRKSRESEYRPYAKDALVQRERGPVAVRDDEDERPDPLAAAHADPPDADTEDEEGALDAGLDEIAEPDDDDTRPEDEY